MTMTWEYVVAVPERRNYLLHLAENKGAAMWETRHVNALCGWFGFAKGEAPTATVARTAEGDKVTRRRCVKCLRKAGLA